MIKMNLPEEDSLNAKAKKIAWNEKYFKKIDKEIRQVKQKLVKKI